MVSNFIKYLTDIIAHFTIKNRIAKNKVISIIIRPIFFFKSIIGLIQILGGNSYFCRKNFENIKIIHTHTHTHTHTYIYIYIFFFFQNFVGIMAPTLQHSSAPTWACENVTTKTLDVNYKWYMNIFPRLLSMSHICAHKYHCNKSHSHEKV